MFLLKKARSFEYFQMEILIISSFKNLLKKKKTDYIWAHLKIEAFQKYKNLVTFKEVWMCVNDCK